MTDTPEIERIRAALAAGPTPGPWNLEPLSAPKSQPMISTDCGNKSPLICVVEYARGGPIVHETALKNADYIAACNPDAMTALLAHIDAQAAEIERLRADAGQVRAARGVPVHWRCVLHENQRPQQLQTRMHSVWFQNADSARVFSETERDLNGWNYTIEPLYAAPQPAAQPAQRKPLTDEMVVAAARMLSDRQAAACNVDCGDMWKLHGNDFIEDARAALEAAHGIKDTP